MVAYQLGPGLYRDVLPAWSDGNLPSLCHMIRSNLFLAHVRASTAGETSRANCHPFKHAGWSFMHNGQIGDIGGIRRTLETLLSDDLYNVRRGTTDSELVFLLLLNYGLQNDPVSAVHSVVEQLKKYSAYGRNEDAVRLTCVFTDGQKLYCFRHSSDAFAPTLYSKFCRDGSWIVASEPLDARPGNWFEAPTNELLVYSQDVDQYASTSI